MPGSLYTALTSLTRGVWKGAESEGPVNELAKAKQTEEYRPTVESDAAGNDIPLPDEPKGWRKLPEGSFPKSEAVARRHIEQICAWNRAADLRGAGNMLHHCLLMYVFASLFSSLRFS